jgi:hypothetical protein
MGSGRLDGQEAEERQMFFVDPKGPILGEKIGGAKETKPVHEGGASLRTEVLGRKLCLAVGEVGG